MKKKELPTSYAFDIFVFELFLLGKNCSRSMQEQQRAQSMVLTPPSTIYPLYLRY